MTLNTFQEEALRRVESLFIRFQDGAVSEIRQQITDSGHVEIEIIPANSEYLPVEILIYKDYIQFSLGDVWHEQPSGLDDYDVNEDVNEIDWRSSYLNYQVTLLEKIFSGRVSVEERRAGGKPYAARCYILDEHGNWKFRGAQGAIFFNYFGKRQKITRYCPLFQDHVTLP